MPIHDAEAFEIGAWKEGFEFGATGRFANDAILDFLTALSRSILNDKTARAYPDLVTFGYFCRRSNLKRAIADLPSSASRFGWGTVVHIAPANIPLNFAYSLVFGLLSGNSNIVRLPSRPFPQTGLCVDHIDRCLAETGSEHLLRRNALVRTDRDSQALTDLIANASGLVVWGGNETVRRFRALPKPPHCIELYFPDRVSSLLIDVAGYNDLSDDDVRLNARRFFNDTYLVDQNACSSPTTVLWLGQDKDALGSAQERFWEALYPILKSEYELDPVARINRDLDILRNVTEVGHALNLQAEHNVWRLDDADVLTLPRRFGTFLELHLHDLGELRRCLRANEQTLTYLAVDPTDILDVLAADSTAPRVDRIVPVGRALEIEFVWDGKEVLSILSRRTQTS